MHPIAGQGFNLGVRDANALARLFAKNNTTTDPGSFENLSQYKQMRLADKAKVIQATDTLVRVFSNHYAPLVTGRNLSLLGLNLLPSLKTRFAKQAMGQR